MDKNWIENYISIDNILNKNKILIDDLVKEYNFTNGNKSVLQNDYEKILDKINKVTNIENYKKLYSLELLDIEKEIILFLYKYINNKCLNYKIIFNSLSKLYNITSILSSRLNLPEIKVKNKKNYIFKTKYKFCQYKSSCQYNYGTTQNNCIGKHYVHNLLKADLHNFINYIKIFKNDTLIQNNKEIIKTIKTFKFVIVRMWEELSTLCMYKDKVEWDKYHRIN